MDRQHVIDRLSKLPHEIAVSEAELLDQEANLRWSRINLKQLQEEFEAMKAIANLL